jgi:3-dehydroquinate dehydratase-2
MSVQIVEIPKITLEPLNETFFAVKGEPAWQKKTFEDLKLNLLLINGPNLNMLGRRDPAQYGTFTLRDVEEQSTAAANARGYKLDCFQSNHEGAIIDRIHESMGLCDGIVINPGAFTHYSYAIYDALELCGMPVVEIHISDISKREDFRRVSVISPACVAQVKGMGIAGYSRAIHILCDTIEKSMVRR